MLGIPVLPGKLFGVFFAVRLAGLNIRDLSPHGPALWALVAEAVVSAAPTIRLAAVGALVDLIVLRGVATVWTFRVIGHINIQQ